MKKIIILYLLLTTAIFATTSNLTVIFDTSGSMARQKERLIKYLSNISNTLYSINDEFPNVDIEFTLIGFNTKANLIFNGKISNQSQLNKLIKKISKVKIIGGTDYQKGFEEARNILSKKSFVNSNILFITDGADGGKGVIPSFDYSSLKGVKMLLIDKVATNNNNIITILETWKKAIPNSTYKVINMLDIQDQIIKSIISLIHTDKKLIRYGKLTQGLFHKHNSNNLKIFLFTNNIKSIKDSNKKSINFKKEKISSSLYKITLSGNAGDYFLQTSKRKTPYLSIEDEEISLGLEILPKSNSKIPDYIENSKLVLNLSFKGKDKKNINYPDFLSLISNYTSVVGATTTNFDTKQFSGVFSLGDYLIKSKWSYSRSFLAQKKESEIGKFKIVKDGLLLSLKHPDKIYEGQSIPIEITYPKKRWRLFSKKKEMKIMINNKEIILKKGSGTNYVGNTPELQKGNYVITLVNNKVRRTQLGFDKNSKTSFNVLPRDIKIEIVGFAPKKKNEDDLDKLEKISNELYEYTFPYYDKDKEKIKVKVTVKPILQNETIVFDCNSIKNKVKLEKLKNYYLGVIPITKTVKEAFTLSSTGCQEAKLTSSNNSVIIITNINKKEGILPDYETIHKKFIMNFKVNNNLNLKGKLLTLSFKEGSSIGFNVALGGIWTGIIIVFLIVLILIIAILIRYNIYGNTLFDAWKKIHNPCLIDYWDGKLINKKLILPSNLKKKSFNNKEEEFNKFLQLKLIEDKKKIKKYLRKTYKNYWTQKLNELEDYVKLVDTEINYSNVIVKKDSVVIINVPNIVDSSCNNKVHIYNLSNDKEINLTREDSKIKFNIIKGVSNIYISGSNTDLKDEGIEEVADNEIIIFKLSDDIFIHVEYSEYFKIKIAKEM